MIDPKLLRDDFQGIKGRLETRNAPESFDSWPELDTKRRSLLGEVEELRATKTGLVPRLRRRKEKASTHPTF